MYYRSVYTGIIISRHCVALVCVCVCVCVCVYVSVGGCVYSSIILTDINILYTVGLLGSV